MVSDMSTRTVLVIEDEAPLRNALQNKFTREGFTVITAPEGYTGLALALAERPDILLLDIMMPKMDGTAVLKKLREDEWGKTAPVVLLTNLGSDFEKNLYEMHGDPYVWYLVKANTPIAGVVKKVKEILGV